MKNNNTQSQIKAITARLLSGKVSNPYPLINKLNGLKNKLREQRNTEQWHDYLSR